MLRSIECLSALGAVASALCACSGAEQADGGSGGATVGSGGAATTTSAASQTSTHTTGTGTGTGSGAGGSDDAAIKLLAWNLEDFPKSNETISIVTSVLGEHQPDVVTLEEIKDLSAWQALDDALLDYTGVIATSGDGFVRVALLYRDSRVTVTNAATVFQNDDYAFPRPMLTARVASASDPSNDFVLGVVHLKAQLDQASADRRRDACVKLDAWVKDQQAAIDDDVVIAGDFNDELTDPPEWNVFGPLLRSADGGFLTLEPEQAGGYTYIPFTSFLDHVLVRGQALGAQSSAEVLLLDETVPGYVDAVSDHRPVLARLRFPTP